MHQECGVYVFVYDMCMYMYIDDIDVCIRSVRLQHCSLPPLHRSVQTPSRRCPALPPVGVSPRSRPLFWVSMLWLIACIALTLVPRPLPWRAPTANWAPVTAVSVAAAVAASWWAPRWGAKRWFLGLASVGGVSYG